MGLGLKLIKPLAEERLLTFENLLVENQHGLLQVVDGSQSASAPDARTAVDHDFVVGRNVGHTFCVEQGLLASLAPVVHPHVLNYRL